MPMFANLLYAIALAAVSPMVIYRMLRHGRYRRGIRDKLLGLSSTSARRLRGGARCVWIHAVSVGEVNLLPRLVQRFEAAHPDCKVVLSTSTDSGYDLAVQRFGVERVFFCPLDFTWAVSRTLRNLAPEQLVLAELELWPNLIRLAGENGCRVAVVNGRLSDRSARRYQQFARLTRPTFARLDWVGCQDADTLKRFADCGTSPSNLQVTGSLKFDDAPQRGDDVSVQSRSQWAGVDPWHRVWVVGSTSPGEEKMALNIYNSLRVDHPELRLVLVPRHRERFDAVAELIRRSGLSAHRRSAGQSQHRRDWTADRVILVDTIGELRAWWGVGQIATVGGSFGSRGGQNMLEPAGYGNAVSFGPDTRNFKDIAGRLIEGGGAVRVKDEAELQQFVHRCLTDIPAANALGRAASGVVESQRGATEKTIAALCDTDQIVPHRAA
jgi:3-deoxy-D-manno-octulosonic-acid transferase